MICPSVSVLHLMCIRSCRECHELMSETDCKNRNSGLIELTDLVDYSSAVLRVSGTVRKHNSVRIVGKYLFRRGSRRIYRNLTASLIKAPCNISLSTEIHKCNLITITVKHILLGTCYLVDNISRAVFLNLRNNLIKIIIFIGGYHAVHGTLFTENFSKSSGINA